MKQQNKAVKEPMPMTEPKYCPYCGGPSVSYSDGSSVCVHCRASFIAARVYPKPELMNDFDRSIVEDSFGKPFALFSRPRMPSSSDLSEIDRALSSLSVPNEVRKEAHDIYRRAYAMEAEGIGSGEGLAAASVFAACKQTGLPKSLDEIAAVFDVDKTEVERAYTCLVNEMGYLPTHLMTSKITVSSDQPIRRIDAENARARLRVTSADIHGPDVSKFMEKKGTYEFLRLLKEKPRRWKTLEKELALSPRTLSERISQALDLGFIEKVRRLKIGATYYRMTKKGSDVFETMIRSTKIY